MKTDHTAATAVAASVPASDDLAVLRCREIVAAVEQVFRGKREVVELVLTCILARGHVLFEDVPGVGKTTLARAFAHVLGLSHRRIQFASDLMPADILGVGIYDKKTERFEFKPGPIFCHVLLADEINRTTPRTQSALLEAMSEGRATVDGTTHRLPQPFVVLATQNPREFHGTYALPESQLDRFLLRLSVGYPGPIIEAELMRNYGAPLDLEAIDIVADESLLLELIARTSEVHVGDEVLDYIHRLAQATRDAHHLELGLSTRAAIGFYRAVQAHALVAGRAFATPDDVQRLFLPIAGHRVVAASTSSNSSGERALVESILHNILETVAPPI